MVVSRAGSCNQFNASGDCWYLVVCIWHLLSIWYCLLCILMCDLFMEFAFVLLQALSKRKGFVTVTTWNRYSFQMVRLNVISYLHPNFFLATHFANGVPFARFPLGIILWPFPIIDFTFSSRACWSVPDWPIL